MDGGGAITTYDIVIIAIFALLIGRGIWLGFLRQITALVALYVGYVAAGQYHDRFFPFLRELSDNPEVVFLAAYALMFICTFIIVTLLGKIMAHAVQISIVGWFDRFLGGVLGCAKALIISVLVHMALGVILPPESRLIRDCQTCGHLDKAAEATRTLIKSEDVRKALRQREPAISLDAVKGALAPLSVDILKKGEGAEPKQPAGDQSDRQK